MSISKPNSALLILGHGSTENPDSSDPTWKLADAIDQTGQFANVYCSFWKEEPSFRQIWPMIEEDEVYIVPNFISEGYFTREVLPRELELEGHTTKRGRLTAHYCDPVGIHPAMTKLLAKRAEEILEAGAAPAETAVIIVGHGTNLNKKSTDAIKTQVDAIKANGTRFAEVTDAYMEEPPFIADWQTLTTAPNVVVVPFFIADGLHSYQDIPVMLGIESEPTEAASQREIFRQNPYSFGDRTLYYSSAIGTEPEMAQVIVDQVEYFDEHYR